MPCIYVGPILNLTDVMPDIDTRVLVVVDDSNFAPNDLGEPDSGRVTDAQIPASPDLSRRIIGDTCNALGCISHQLAVVGTDYGRFKRAFVFLGVLILSRCLSGR